MKVLLLLALALPLFGAVLGPEVPLSTPVMEPAPGFHGTPAVASNGDGFLVVWTGGGKLRATRLDANGDPMDAEALTVGVSGGVSVASDGRDYVIASGCGTRDHPRVCFTHVGAGTGAFTPRGAIDPAMNAKIASTGRSYLVVYYNPRSGLEAVPLRLDGSPSGPPYGIDTTQQARLAASGQSYLAVYPTRDRLNAVLLAEDGIRGPRERLAPFTDDYDVASDGTDFLAIWSGRDGEQAAAVSSAGVTAPPRRLPGTEGPQRLAWSGSRYVVGAPQFGHNGIEAFEVSRTAEPLTERRNVATVAGRRHSVGGIASNGRTTLVAWAHAAPAGSSDVIEAALLTGAEAVRTFVVSLGVPEQASVAATRSGSRTIVAWDENHGRQQRRKVFVQRLDEQGTPLDGRGLAVSDSPYDQVRPALAGSVVAWVELGPAPYGSDAVWARALDATGAPTGLPRRIAWVSDASSVAVVKPEGLLHYVVWRDAGIHAARFSSLDGTYDPTPFPVSSFDYADRDPVAVASDDGFLVLWRHLPEDSLHAAAFTRWGSPLGSPVRVASSASSRPSAVWNGREYVVFWSSGEAFAQALGPTATPVALRRSLGSFAVKSAAWTGDGYTLAFERGWLSIGRYDRDLGDPRFDSTYTVPAADGAVIFDDLLIYLARQHDTSRVVARRIDRNAAPIVRRRSSR